MERNKWGKRKGYCALCLLPLPLLFLVSFLLWLSSIQPIFCTCTWTLNPVCFPLPFLSLRPRLEIVLAGRREQVGGERGGWGGQKRGEICWERGRGRSSGDRHTHTDKTKHNNTQGKAGSCTCVCVCTYEHVCTFQTHSFTLFLHAGVNLLFDVFAYIPERKNITNHLGRNDNRIKTNGSIRWMSPKVYRWLLLLHHYKIQKMSSIILIIIETVFSF